jgi:hypothetical protein
MGSSWSFWPLRSSVSAEAGAGVQAVAVPVAIVSAILVFTLPA